MKKRLLTIGLVIGLFSLTACGPITEITEEDVITSKVESTDPDESDESEPDEPSNLPSEPEAPSKEEAPSEPEPTSENVYSDNISWGELH